MKFTKEEVQRLIAALHADPYTADWDDALSLLRAKRDEKDAAPVALLDGNGENVYFPSDAMFHYWLGRNCTKHYTRPAHDDTALLRQALEALLSANNDCQELSHHKGDFHKLGEPCKPMQRFEFAITALRERLGEKV